ncbi:MAG: prepilin-type N-terminal cleavage/methylation domain-containing protein [Patescibacteria group bacterium]|nr:prepilin-type N-terminal cleavage/methylation domain-containing protein [Patescibacteria group bacterium]
MSKKAFTLIELMITMTIIAMMLVVAVPGFEKYGKKSSLKLKAAEIGALINQASTMAKNPEQNISRYLIKVDSSAKTVGLYRADDSTSNLIKEIAVPTDYTLAIQGNSNPYLVFNSQLDFTCQMPKASGIIADCTQANQLNGNFLTMSSTDGGTATFKISPDPFRVEY